MKKTFSLIVLGIACFGCASTSITKQHNIAYITESSVFNFKYDRAEQNAGITALKQVPIYEGIVRTVLGASSFPKKSLFKANTNKLSYVKGISISQVPSGLEVVYLNGEYYHGVDMESVTSVKALYRLDWQDLPNHVTLNVTFPEKLEVSYGKDGLFQRIEPLANLVAIEKDVVRINDALVSELMNLASKNI